MSKSWISVTRARFSGVKPCNLPFEFPPAQRLRQPKVPRWQQWRKQSSSTALTSVTKELFLLDEVLFYVHMEYGGVDTRSFIDRTENGRLLPPVLSRPSGSRTSSHPRGLAIQELPQRKILGAGASSVEKLLDIRICGAPAG